jgi:catechol 2,3-dioxygenase-like lactoylglutathione lyase family enzyme
MISCYRTSNHFPSPGLATPLAACFFVVVTLLITPLSRAQSAPQITGIERVTFYVTDVAKAKSFYGDFLGYDVHTSPAEAWFDINPKQSIHLVSDSRPGDRLGWITFTTNDPDALRDLFASRGLFVPAKLGPDAVDAPRAFKIMDPDGHVLEFERPGEPLALSIPPTAISARMSHAGILVSSLDQSMKFYRDLLGFQETWRGSRNNKILSWVNLKVPDGNDYVEFMLYSQLPPATGRGTQHHICLEVPDVEKAWEILQTRTLPKECKAPTEMKLGVNGKRQINLFDPDGTRVEIMEPGTFDGRRVSSSTAPAPQGEPLMTELLHSKAAEGMPQYAPAK